MTRQDELRTALLHLQSARRLLRSAYALRAIASVNRAINATEGLLDAGRPIQRRLALEADDAPLAS